MVSGDRVGTEAFGELEADLLYEAAGVDEDECGAMLVREGGKLIEDLGPHGRGGDGAELVRWHLDGEIEGTALANLDDGGGVAVWVGAHQKVGDQFDRVLGCGQTNALRRLRHAGEHGSGREAVFATDESVEALKREGEVGAAFIVGDGMDFVDDDGLDARARLWRDLPAVSRM